MAQEFFTVSRPQAGLLHSSMPQISAATLPQCPAGHLLHRCVNGHPLNPISYAAWQCGGFGTGMPASHCYLQDRKCQICRHEIKKNWVRLGCAKGCQECVCYNMNCAARVL